MLCRGEFGSQGTSQEDIGHDMTLLLQDGCKGGLGSQGAKSRGKAQSGQTAIPSLSWGWIGHTCFLVAVGCDIMSLQKDIQMIHSF